MVVGGGWSYDYSVSLSPILWIMTFLIWTWTLDFGLTIFDLDLFGLGLWRLKVYGWWVGGPMIIASG